MIPKSGNEWNNSNPHFINPKSVNDGQNNNSNPHFINPKSVNDGQD